MSKYIFETAEFGISESGIHLLRSRYNYKSFNYKEVDLFQVYKGRLINNWIIILIIGIGLIVFGVFYTVRLFAVFNDPEIHRIYIEEILVPVFPLFLGGYCVFIASKTGPVLKLIIGTQKKSLPLTEIKRRNQLPEFISLLKSTEGVKSKLRVDLE